MKQRRVQSLGREKPLEKEVVTHSAILAWRIPWTEDPGGLKSMGSQESDTIQQLSHQYHSQLMAQNPNFPQICESLCFDKVNILLFIVSIILALFLVSHLYVFYFSFFAVTYLALSQVFSCCTIKVVCVLFFSFPFCTFISSLKQLGCYIFPFSSDYPYIFNMELNVLF